MNELRMHHHETTLDRAGLAVAVGGLLGGAVAMGLAAMGSTSGPLGLTAAFILGALLCALAITAVATPIWIFMHLTGRRAAGHAALVGAATGFVVFVFSQTYGFGLFEAPPSDLQTLLFRWASAAATSVILAAVAAVIGLVMWRVAYRSLR
ncbi:MAG: hypothetical protein B7Y43_11005 [Sphingomonas sp. 28-62-20]|uniref:hypothetical protein n=1 Tax=unclassified Sphingomonas TaxID=196159 RepID=UPI000BC7BD2D|nr:hypothetical protein [Sphingomonas sp.]OYY77393.1 MAG: hypothetical protein B7Y43_11005 [Sphingomonas sp. 28-62-20]